MAVSSLKSLYSVGKAVGISVGDRVGFLVGRLDGTTCCVGASVEPTHTGFEGWIVGAGDGTTLEARVGEMVGFFVGEEVGDPVGLVLISTEGESLDVIVGLSLGTGTGASV